MKIGKTTITLRADGCTDCGTEWCHSWETARVVRVVIDGRERELSIHRCGDCAKRRRPLLERTEAA